MLPHLSMVSWHLYPMNFSWLTKKQERPGNKVILPVGGSWVGKGETVGFLATHANSASPARREPECSCNDCLWGKCHTAPTAMVCSSVSAPRSKQLTSPGLHFLCCWHHYSPTLEKYNLLGICESILNLPLNQCPGLHSLAWRCLSVPFLPFAIILGQCSLAHLCNTEVATVFAFHSIRQVPSTTSFLDVISNCHTFVKNFTFPIVSCSTLWSLSFPSWVSYVPWCGPS